MTGAEKENVLEQKVDWLTAMEVKIKLDQRRRKPMMQGAGRTSVWQPLRARHVSRWRGAAVLSYGLGGRSTGEDVELEPAR